MVKLRKGYARSSRPSKREGCDFTVKTYRRDKSGVRLEPANPNYPVIRLRAGQELDYFGKVTACIHRFAGKR